MQSWILRKRRLVNNGWRGNLLVEGAEGKNGFGALDIAFWPMV
jgi:hypothetical protein